MPRAHGAAQLFRAWCALLLEVAGYPCVKDSALRFRFTRCSSRGRFPLIRCRSCLLLQRSALCLGMWVSQGIPGGTHRKTCCNQRGGAGLTAPHLARSEGSHDRSLLRPPRYFFPCIWLPGLAALLLLSGRRCLGALGFLKISLENNRLHATPESQGDAHWKLITPVHN